MALRLANELRKATVSATDGDVGRVDDLYFDEQHWTLRYLIVNTGGWLAGRRVLIAPVFLAQVDWPDQRLHVTLTRAQVEASPPLESLPRISRRYEVDYFRHYGVPLYWAGPGVWGAAAAPVDLARIPPEPIEPTPPLQDLSATHLHAVSDVAGHHIAATDGDIGHVEDFLFDDHTWTIRYLVVDTSNWWGGTRVLIAPAWTREVAWLQRLVTVELTRDQVKNAPPLGTPADLTRNYEARLHDHYRRVPYWR